MKNNFNKYFFNLLLALLFTSVHVLINSFLFNFCYPTYYYQLFNLLIWILLNQMFIWEEKK